MRPAVFLDRDGVLNELVSRDGQMVSPQRAADFRLLPGIRQSVDRLRGLGVAVFIITNQPDIARGKMPASELARMTEILRAEVTVDDVSICTHDDADHCECRKPSPGMLRVLAEKWGVDLGRSAIVGDSWKDIEAGRRAGCHTVQVGVSRSKPEPDHLAQDLAGAVDHLEEWFSHHTATRQA